MRPRWRSRTWSRARSHGRSSSGLCGLNPCTATSSAAALGGQVRAGRGTSRCRRRTAYDRAGHHRNLLRRRSQLRNGSGCSGTCAVRTTGLADFWAACCNRSRASHSADGTGVLANANRLAIGRRVPAGRAEGAAAAAIWANGISGDVAGQRPLTGKEGIALKEAVDCDFGCHMAAHSVDCILRSGGTTSQKNAGSEHDQIWNSESHSCGARGMQVGT